MVWRRGLWEVIWGALMIGIHALREEAPQSSLVLPCKDSEKYAIYEPDRGPPQNPSISTTVKSKCTWFISHLVSGIFVTSA